MWTSVFMSKDEKSVDLLRQALRLGSVLTKISRNAEYYEIFVPSCEVSCAHNIIIDTNI